MVIMEHYRHKASSSRCALGCLLEFTLDAQMLQKLLGSLRSSILVANDPYANTTLQVKAARTSEEHKAPGIVSILPCMT